MRSNIEKKISRKVHLITVLSLIAVLSLELFFVSILYEKAGFFIRPLVRKIKCLLFFFYYYLIERVPIYFILFLFLFCFILFFWHLKIFCCQLAMMQVLLKKS